METIEKRQGYKIMCLEEIALEMKFVTPDNMRETADALGLNDYGRYVRRRVEEFARGG